MLSIIYILLQKALAIKVMFNDGVVCDFEDIENYNIQNSAFFQSELKWVEYYGSKDEEELIHLPRYSSKIFKICKDLVNNICIKGDYEFDEFMDFFDMIKFLEINELLKECHYEALTLPTYKSMTKYENFTDVFYYMNDKELKYLLSHMIRLKDIKELEAGSCAIRIFRDYVKIQKYETPSISGSDYLLELTAITQDLIEDLSVKNLKFFNILLKKFNIRDLSLDGNINDDFIANLNVLSNITSFCFTNNKISSHNASFFSLENLKHLKLNFGVITSDAFKFVNLMKQLESLELTSNLDFQRFSPRQISNLKNLKIFKTKKMLMNKSDISQLNIFKDLEVLYVETIDNEENFSSEFNLSLSKLIDLRIVDFKYFGDGNIEIIDPLNKQMRIYHDLLKFKRRMFVENKILYSLSDLSTAFARDRSMRDFRTQLVKKYNLKPLVSKEDEKAMFEMMLESVKTQSNFYDDFVKIYDYDKNNVKFGELKLEFDTFLKSENIKTADKLKFNMTFMTLMPTKFKDDYKESVCLELENNKEGFENLFESIYFKDATISIENVIISDGQMYFNKFCRVGKTNFQNFSVSNLLTVEGINNLEDLTNPEVLYRDYPIL